MTEKADTRQKGAKDRLIVYVDGFNLYHGLHSAAGCQLLWLDVVRLAQSLRPRSAVVQVKYFTAIVLDEPEAQSRQDRYIQALSQLYPGRLTVIKGEYKRRPKRCRDCGATWVSYEEKQTDVNIAVHLVADVAANRADSHMIISGDSDIIPAVKMSRALRPDATIFAQFPPGRALRALQRLMPSSREITLARIKSALLPLEVKTQKGGTFQCPEKWLPAAPSGEPAAASGVAPTFKPARRVTPADIATHVHRA